MARGRRKAKDIDPYLSTSDFLEISGVSSMTLRTYESHGLIEPAYRNEEDGYKYWSLDQIPLIGLIDAMRSGGATNKQVAHAQLEGKVGFLLGSYNMQAAKLRQDRRMMKSIVHSRRRFDDLQRVVGAEGYYLRYLPLRWMAIAPIAPHRCSFEGNRHFMNVFRDLLKVSTVVGWCTTMTFGTLISVSADGSRASRYAYIELASPPMPQTTGSMVVDGGCYRVFDKSFNEKTCANASCEACARFGCAPQPTDMRHWNASEGERPFLFDRVLTSDRVSAPIAKGDTWERFKREALSAQGAAVRDFRVAAEVASGSSSDDEDSCAVPCRMPLDAKLPMGVTACSLPAGVHLCKQIGFEDEVGKQDLLDFAQSLAPSGRTPEDIEASLGHMESDWRIPAKQGPFVEPFAMPRDHGVPDLRGFSRALSDREARRIARVQPAGLELEDGYCVTSSNMVMSYDQSVTQEYHVLIDPEGFLPGS